MFGCEDYAFFLVNIADERFVDECSTMSSTLGELLSAQQIVENDWRTAYKRFLDAEKRRASLTPGAQQKSIERADALVAKTKSDLLKLQNLRDEKQRAIHMIWGRCEEIKKFIEKEHALEKLRQDLNQKVKLKFPKGDPFWKSKFKVRMSVPPSVRS
jgi:hypothetical protein